MSPVSMVGNTGSLASFIPAVVMINGAMLLLFFLNKWGKQIIIDAMNSKEEVQKVISLLSETMKQVENGTQVLGDNTLIMSENASATLESSKQVATAMKEIASGVQEQAESVADINMQVETISTDVDEVHNISAEITSSNNVINVRSNFRRRRNC